MKKIVLIVFGAVILIALFAGWRFFGPSSYFKGPLKYLYIPTNNATKEEVLELIEKDSMVSSITSFSWLANRMDYWKQIKPGKYKIEPKNSVFDIIRLLKNGRQSPVNLVITKLRTKEDLASLAGKKFEFDSTAMIDYLTDEDSLHQFNLDSNTVMTAVFPNTYTFFWNTTPDKIFYKLIHQYKEFWTPERRAAATAKGLNPQTAYILASIIEEETNKNDEKGNIASVYLNRISKGMKLGADPTVKFALKDFSLKRIYTKYTLVQSPYNTYQVYGLPPGPICTPSTTTINAVLTSPKTDYMYFVAKSDFSGHHTFSTTYEQHMKHAKEYQEALNKYMQAKLAKDSLKNKIRMTKLERLVLNLLPVKLLIRKSQRIILPGFQGLPLYDVIVFFIRQVKKVGLSERASSIAFNFLMAIPAAVIFLCTLLPYIPVSKRITAQLLVLANDFIRDRSTFLAVEKFLNDFLNTPRSGLLSLGFFLAVLYASNAMLGIMRTFNKSLLRSSKRNYFESRWMAIKLTTLVIALIILSLILSIVQGEVFNRLLIWMNVNSPSVKGLISSLRYFVIVALIFYAIAFIYKYAPAVKERWQLSSPGTILATFLTIVTTFMFSFWVSHFGNYNKIYGSIGTILIIMLLTYINAFILLIGFELNVSIHSIKGIAEERQVLKDKTCIN